MKGLNVIIQKMKEWALEIDRFWLGPVSLRALSLFRILIGLNLLVLYSIRHSDLEFLYKGSAVVPYQNSLDILPKYFVPIFSWFPETASQVDLYHSSYLFALVLLILGIGGRYVSAVCLFFHLSFMQRNYAVVYGAEIVSCYWLMFLCLSDNCRYFSVRNLVSKFKRTDQGGDWMTSVGFRMIQIQLCIIYAYTGWEKLRGNDWWSGLALWQVMGNEQLAIFNMSFIKEAPVLVAIMTHFTILLEVYFPVLVWFKKWRNWMILFGVGLHIGIIFVMGLFFFGTTMMAAYLLFLGDDFFKYLSQIKSGLGKLLTGNLAHN